MTTAATTILGEYALIRTRKHIAMRHVSCTIDGYKSTISVHTNIIRPKKFYNEFDLHCAVGERD